MTEQDKRLEEFLNQFPVFDRAGVKPENLAANEAEVRAGQAKF